MTSQKFLTGLSPATEWLSDSEIIAAQHCLTQARDQVKADLRQGTPDVQRYEIWGDYLHVLDTALALLEHSKQWLQNHPHPNLFTIGAAIVK